MLGKLGASPAPCHGYWYQLLWGWMLLAVTVSWGGRWAKLGAEGGTMDPRQAVGS